MNHLAQARNCILLCFLVGLTMNIMRGSMEQHFYGLVLMGLAFVLGVAYLIVRGALERKA